MPVSHELQNVIGDVSAAIAAGDSWSRVKLEKLRRTLNALARDAGQVERLASAEHAALAELAHGVERGVADLSGLARRVATAAGLEVAR